MLLATTESVSLSEGMKSWRPFWNGIGDSRRQSHKIKNESLLQGASGSLRRPVGRGC
jgi:hypothetical protein